jgi:hypothetical protein
MKVEGMPLPNPPVDGANDLPHPLSEDICPPFGEGFLLSVIH